MAVLRFGSSVNISAKKGYFSAVTNYFYVKIPNSDLILLACSHYFVGTSFPIGATEIKEACPWLRQVGVWSEFVKLRGCVDGRSDGQTI